MAERITVDPDVWKAIEDGARQGHHPRTVMVEWWRLVLDKSVEEWESLDPGGVSVMDYEVSVEDGARLHAIVMSSSDSKLAAMAWLDIGPKVAD